MEQTLKHKAVNGVLWRVAEQGGKQLIYFGISVVLARLIMPDQFGMVAMLTVFTAVAGVFIDSGFSTALVRKTDRTQADCSTVYWFNIVISIVCYLILFVCAPLVGRFYDMPQLTAILRVSALGLVIGSLAGVHRTLLQAEMDFKSLTKFNLLGIFISGSIGIFMAWLGFEVWALVTQGLILQVISTICVWYKVKWRPSFIVSRDSFNEFFGFGSKMLASSLLDTIYSNIYSIVIGKVYRAADLAYYNRGSSLCQMTSSLPTGILQSVTYPTLCKLQHDNEALKRGYRRTLRIAAFVIFPMCIGMGAVAYPLINVLYTEIWIYTATPALHHGIQHDVVSNPCHQSQLPHSKRPKRPFFRLEVIKKIQGVIILCVTIPLGLEAMCYGSIVSSLLSLIWNTYYNGKFLNMSIFKQLHDFSPILLLSGVMYIGARSVAYFMGNDLTSLICSVATGAAIYIGGAFLFRFPEIKELKELKK